MLYFNNMRKKKYEILEHKADLKIRVFGKDKKEVFSNALLGMFEEARYKQISNLKPQISKRKIKIKSQDSGSLLVDFLSEALYLSEINQEVYRDIRFRKFNDKEIDGVLIGKKLKRIGVQIKGVTYHGLDIHQEKDGSFEATILFDI